jgi:sialate O-acetylesterase
MKSFLSRRPLKVLGTVFVTTLLASARAEVKPNGLFCEGAVLQQNLRVPVWGTARDGEKVTVTIQGREVSTMAKAGRWRVELQPLKPGGPFTFVIAGDNTITLTNILVGEVWLSSGQSNMSFPLSRATNAAEAIAAADDPQLRLFAVPHEATDEPKTDVAAAWKTSAPATVPNFSAVAYFFGRDLRRALKVPVGLIDASVGGTPAQAWTPMSTLKADPDLKEILARYDESVKTYDPAKAAAEYESEVKKYQTALEKAKAAGKPVPREPQKPADPARKNNRPACLYNAMIAPLQPYALAGVIWYQGEANAGRAAEYQILFPAMIHGWRAAWALGDFPFLFVQIAPYHELTPEIREAQLLSWQRVTNTAMVVTTDVGEELNIHPTKKEPVGARLALAARAVAYGEKLEFSGPVFAAMNIRGRAAELSFTHLGGGLVARGGELKGFLIAGADGLFVPAAAKIQGEKILVTAPSVAKPVAVRYGWAKTPDVNLFNQAGLPASPFRTDKP